MLESTAVRFTNQIRSTGNSKYIRVTYNGREVDSYEKAAARAK